jgi:hypothetical protein
LTPSYHEKRMGWVKDRFDEQAVYAVEVPRLWNRMRDSIGVAIREFNERTTGTPNSLDRTDCRDKGGYCTRILKAVDNSSIEVYLDERSQSLNASRGGHTAAGKICGYRITEDRKGAEFFVQDAEGNARALTVDDACEMALSEFIFPTTSTKL